MKRSHLSQIATLAIAPAALTATDASAERIYIQVEAQLNAAVSEVGATAFESVYDDFLPSLRSGGALDLTYIYDVDWGSSSNGGTRQIELVAFSGSVDGLSFDGFIDEAGVMKIRQWSDDMNSVTLIGGYDPAAGVPSLTDVLATMSFQIPRTEVIPDFTSPEVDIFEEPLTDDVWQAIAEGAVETGMGALAFVEVTANGPAMRTYGFEVQEFSAFDVRDGDLNADGIVDGGDLSIMILQGKSRTTFALCDLNNDGEVDGGDLNILLLNWGETEASSSSGESAPPKKDDPYLPEDE